MKWALLLFVVACSSEKKQEHADKLDMNEIKTEAAVEFAEKSMPELDAKLASADPGAASSLCTVIMGDYKRIEKAKPELAATIKTRCKRDQYVRSLAVLVDRMEKDKSECSKLSIWDKPLVREGLMQDAEVVKLHERAAAACPPK